MSALKAVHSASGKATATGKARQPLAEGCVTLFRRVPGTVTGKRPVAEDFAGNLSIRAAR